MDAEVIKVICNNYEQRITMLEGLLGSERTRVHELELQSLCLARGGHEFEMAGEPGIRYEQCKFCKMLKDN